eukprot:sb/3475666/
MSTSLSARLRASNVNTPPVRMTLRGLGNAAKYANRWKSRSGVSSGPTAEELRLQALDKARQGMTKESDLIFGNLRKLSCLIANMRRETTIDAEYVRLEIKKLTKRAIQGCFVQSARSVGRTWQV